MAFVVARSDGRVSADTCLRILTSTISGSADAFSAPSGSAAILPSVATTGHAEVLPAEAVDGAYFTTLAVGAQLGRVIQPDDDKTAARVRC